MKYKKENDKNKIKGKKKEKKIWNKRNEKS